MVLKIGEKKHWRSSYGERQYNYYLQIFPRKYCLKKRLIKSDFPKKWDLMRVKYLLPNISRIIAFVKPFLIGKFPSVD